MTKEKQLYVSPETEALVIRFEGVICGSPNYGQAGGAGADQNYNNYGSDF